MTEGPLPHIDRNVAAISLATDIVKALIIIGGPTCQYRVDLIDPKPQYSSEVRYEKTEGPHHIPYRSEAAVLLHEALTERFKLEFERSLEPMGWARLAKIV